MTMKKIAKFVNDRIALFVGVGIIISVHWGWYRLQQVPYYVSESERKSLPFVRAANALQEKVAGLFSDANPPDEAARDTKTK